MSSNPVDGMSRREFFAELTAATSTGDLMSLAGPVIERLTALVRVRVV